MYTCKDISKRNPSLSVPTGLSMRDCIALGDLINYWSPYLTRLLLVSHTNSLAFGRAGEMHDNPEFRHPSRVLYMNDGYEYHRWRNLSIQSNETWMRIHCINITCVLLIEATETCNGSYSLFMMALSVRMHMKCCHLLFRD